MSARGLYKADVHVYHVHMSVCKYERVREWKKQDCKRKWKLKEQYMYSYDYFYWNVLSYVVSPKAKGSSKKSIGIIFTISVGMSFHQSKFSLHNDYLFSKS